jgi:hypothetical protein
MTTKEKKTLEKEARIAFDRLRENEDFRTFLLQILVGGINICQKDENGEESTGITIGIINEKN